jgi:hypothetical protein
MHIDFPLENGVDLDHFKSFISKLSTWSIDLKNVTIVLSSVYEVYNWKEREKILIAPIKKILKNYGIEKSIDLVNTTYSDNRPSIRAIDSLIELEFFALITYYRINYLNTPVNSKWNRRANKALLMTGKPNKINRIGLLGCFVENKLINRLDWSFHPFNDIADYSESNPLELERFCSMNYNLFCKNYTRSAGNIEIKRKPNSNHYSGFPYDVSLYSNTLLSVVSETGFSADGRVWLTEKTWRPIANKHPFIIAGDVGSLEKLNKLGFKTFERYLKYQNYDLICDPFQRIQYIVENTEYFLDNYQKHIKSIQKDIEHNYQRFNEMCRLELNNYPMFKDEKFLHKFFEYRLNDS